MAIVYGLVPKPLVTISHLDYDSHRMIGYSAEAIVIEGFVLHRMIGTLWGTDGWFHAGKAATAYGVGVVSVDGSDDEGRIIEWIDPANGHYYGHSSGPVSEPYGDGLAFVKRFGVDRVNPQTVACEISGNYETPLDNSARHAIASLMAYYADQRKLPWSTFPEVPGQDRSFVLWHQEFTIGTGKQCPGKQVMDATDNLISRCKAILKTYQEGSAASETYAVRKPIPGPLESQTYGNKPFVRATGSLTLAKDTSPLQYAVPTARPVSPPYVAGRKVSPAYTTIGDDQELWVVEKSGGRFPFSAFEEGQP